MNKNLDVITHAVTLIIKAAIMAARFSGRVRKRRLKRLAAMDTDTKDKEILFLKDKVYYEKKPEKPKRDSKTVPCNIEQHFFKETRINGYRLKNVA